MSSIKHSIQKMRKDKKAKAFVASLRVSGRFCTPDSTTGVVEAFAETEIFRVVPSLIRTWLTGADGKPVLMTEGSGKSSLNNWKLDVFIA